MRLIQFSSKEKLRIYINDAVSKNWMVMQNPPIETFPIRVVEYREPDIGLIGLHEANTTFIF